MNIKKLRNKFNMSQSEFSNRFNISVRTLQGWEQNRSTPPKYVVDLIYEIYIREQNVDNIHLFRSAVQHNIKRNELKFVYDTITDGDIIIYYKIKDFFKCFYLLACVDFLCKKNNLPVAEEYDMLRVLKLDKPIYLNGQCNTNLTYINEFENYNIYEVSIYDVC